MKLFTVIFVSGFFICSPVFGENGPGKKPVPAKSLISDGTKTDKPQKTAHNAGLSPNRIYITASGDSIGFTYYDYPTNGCSKSNIFFFETGEIYVMRMANITPPGGTPDLRGTYVRFYDGSDWSSGWERVEETGTGFMDGGVFDNGAGWAMAHPGIFSLDTAFGAMSWNSRPPNGNPGLWPVAASVGNDTVFYVSTLSGGTGPTSGMIFTRSFDRGITWSNPYRLDSAVANPFGLNLRTAEGYHITAFHNHVAAVQVSFPVSGQPQNYYGAVNLYESDDYGTTWTRRLINPAMTPEPVPQGTKEERAYIDPYALYDQQGRLHVVWTTLTRWVDSAAGTNGYYFTEDNRILHWSDVTGISVAASLPEGASGSNIDGNDMNIGYLGIPSLAFDDYGNAAVVYHQVSEPSDTDAAGYIYYQIYTAASPNNGLNWYSPVNATNSYGYDNMGANVAPYFGSDYYLYIVYNSDPFTGNQVQGSQTVEWPVAVKVLRMHIGPLEVVKEAEKFYRSLHLKQNYPNPFNPSTVIEYEVKTATPITLKIFNILGQEVKTLIQSRCNPGSYRVIWDGRDNSGNAVSSGIYLYRLEAGGQNLTRKMILLK